MKLLNHGSRLGWLEATFFCFTFTGLFVLCSFLKSFVPGSMERLAHGTIGTLVALGTTYLFLRIDKKSFADIGLKFEKATLKRFFSGVLAGIVLMGLLALSAIFMADFKIEFNPNSNLLYFLYATLPLIPLAFMEELGFRGYPLVLLQEKSGSRKAIIITSVLFALYHIANGWPIQGAFLGAGVWGIIYGLAAVYSRGLAMPTGIHYAANLIQAVFGLSNDSYNLLILKQQDGTSLENYQSSTMETVLPQISLLIFGVICMKWFLGRK